MGPKEQHKDARWIYRDCLFLPHLFQSQHVCRAPIQKAHDRRPSRTGSFFASLLSLFLKVTHSGGPSLFFLFFFSPSFSRSLLKRFFLFFIFFSSPHCDMLWRPSKRKGTTKDCEGQRLLVPIRILPFSAIHENQKCFMLFMADSSFFLPLKPVRPFHVFHLGLCDSGFTAPVKLSVISQILALKWWLTPIRGRHWRLKHGTRCWQPLGWWAGGEVCSTPSTNAIRVAVSRGGFCLKQWWSFGYVRRKKK